MAGLSWWPEIHRSFQVSLTPTLVAKGTTSARAALILTPALAFTGRSHMHASVALSLTPSLSMLRLSYPGAAGLLLTPSLSMAGREHYARTVTLALTPAIAMAGHNKANVGLSLTPAIGMSAAQHNTVFTYTLPFNLA